MKLVNVIQEESALQCLGSDKWCTKLLTGDDAPKKNLQENHIDREINFSINGTLFLQLTDFMWVFFFLCVYKFFTLILLPSGFPLSTYQIYGHFFSHSFHTIRWFSLLLIHYKGRMFFLRGVWKLLHNWSEFEALWVGPRVCRGGPIWRDICKLHVLAVNRGSWCVGARFVK